jgi:VRR-NUC domain
MNAVPGAWARPMTEAEVMEKIRVMCFDLRLLVFHAHDSRRSWGPGFPDLVIVGPNGILFVEVKNATNSLRVDQRRWGSAINRAGGMWAIWRPAELVNGTIARRLAAIAELKEAA